MLLSRVFGITSTPLNLANHACFGYALSAVNLPLLDHAETSCIALSILPSLRTISSLTAIMLYAEAPRLIVHQNWVGEMASYLKSIDPKHLLEIGLEGFYGRSIPDKIKINPNSYQFGTDYIANNQIPEIDFVTVHSYPDQWLNNAPDSAQLTFLGEWVSKHIEDAQNIIKKPVMFAEFGKSYKVQGYTAAGRDKFYSTIYNQIYESASKGGAASGGLFWQLLSLGMDNYRDGYDVVLTQGESLGKLIYEEAHKLSNLRV